MVNVGADLNQKIRTKLEKATERIQLTNSRHFAIVYLGQVSAKVTQGVFDSSGSPLDVLQGVKVHSLM